jgi:malonyl-CoA reductase/3-hydroxypropionate dehydrogenase (NADP+)
MNHAGRLSGKVALITGGAGNIGEVITRRFLAEGATVIITGRNEQKLTDYSTRLCEADVSVAERLVPLRMDGSNSADVRAGIALIGKRFARLDVLVNNAGTAGARQRITDIPLRHEDLDGDTETLDEGIGNLLGITWNVTRAAMPLLPPGGSVINISTIFSRTNYYGRIPYVVPKAALNALSQHLAVELGAHGVRVNTIYPGPIDSERIRTVFSRMDALKGMPTNSTAEQFFDMMRLSRSDSDGIPAKRFPTTLDVANTVIFLASDESAAFNGHAFEVTHGMAVPAESQTTFVARPALRAVDARGRVTLICAGDQVEDVLALTGVLRSCGSDVIIGYRSRAAIAQLERIFEESRRLPGASMSPPLVLYLNPLEPQSVTSALAWVDEYAGNLQAVVVLPGADVGPVAPRLSEADDAFVARFLNEELVAPIALASQFARYWQTRRVTAAARFAPRVIFLSNGDDRNGNVYADILRAGIEQLVRVWRHEAQLDHARALANGDDEMLLPIWANQIVRWVNAENESLDFACAWVANLLHTERRIEEINLYLPQRLLETTGTQRPWFGWAESLIGMHLGKVALITGGSAGIGGQIGRLLALSGATVVLAARGKTQLAHLRDTIRSELVELGYNDLDTRVRIVADCDVADEASLAALVDEVLATCGRVDYLINNAGISGVEEMAIDIPLDAWRHTLSANLLSNYSLLRKVAPLMKAQGSGYILNVSSYFGGEKYVAIPYPNRADYAVSKAGQRAMAEVLARFLGPEIQINALAPGPVDGDRLRGTGERPGLFARRGRLILENRRLSEIYTALIEAWRASDRTMSELLAPLATNQVAELANDAMAAPELRHLAATILQGSDSEASSRDYLLNTTIARKLLQRLQDGAYLAGDTTVEAVLQAERVVPEPFFSRTQIEREARKVREGIMGMLYLQRMPTEFDVALATVYYLADRNVTGETFHPSGGLRFERTPTGGELFGDVEPQRLALLAGSTVLLIGEYLHEHLTLLAQTYLGQQGVKQVVMLTETAAAAQKFAEHFAEAEANGHLHVLATEGDIERGIALACERWGRLGPVVSTPFRPLPVRPLAARGTDSWSQVLNEQEFADLLEQQITHHFRVAHKVCLMDGVQLVLVTPETTVHSTTEQFALANFIKTTLHAFTATAGVESERTVHRPLINQIDLGRQARSEEPRSDIEHLQEMVRFVEAVLLVTAPLPAEDDTRYQARIHRGRAITV